MAARFAELLADELLSLRDKTNADAMSEVCTKLLKKPKSAFSFYRANKRSQETIIFLINAKF